MKMTPDKDQLKRHIQKSDLTAIEKRYLEGLVDAQCKTDGRRLIDADALKEKLSEITISVSGVRAGKEFVADAIKAMGEYIIQAIDSTPTVDAKPVRHGRCISDIYGMTCSECGSNLYMSRINFCPSCGAKMDHK